MTITYTGQVANARLCGFSRLLGYWKGSIYKLIYKEMLLFCTFYIAISLIYRYALLSHQQRIFEKIALHCEEFTNLIPLSFILGFYVSIVVTRWWNQYMSIPWPDKMMLYVTTMIEGADEHCRLIRRTIMRYLTLGSIFVFQATSVSVKKRFPTIEHVFEAGIVTASEVKMFNEIHAPHGKWFIPFVWSANLIKQARNERHITDDYLMKCLLEELNDYRGKVGLLYSYDWISVPLVYTQVTTLAVYTFFLGSLFGRQFLDPAQGYSSHQVDLYVPTFTLLQFFFYMGWLKVAEQLINPFGEDDDDFDMNWIIDRNMSVSLLTVDELSGRLPPLERDIYWGEAAPDFLPYTKSSINTICPPHMGSTAELSVSNEGMKVINPLETILEVEGNPLEQGNWDIPQTNVTASSPTPSIASRSQKYMKNIVASMSRSGSRNMLDNKKFTTSPLEKSSVGRFKVQTMNGSAMSNIRGRPYLEQWMQEHHRTSCQNLSKVNVLGSRDLSRATSCRSSLDHCSDNQSLAFDMENDQSSYKCHGDENRGGLGNSTTQKLKDESVSIGILPQQSPSTFQRTPAAEMSTAVSFAPIEEVNTEITARRYDSTFLNEANKSSASVELPANINWSCSNALPANPSPFHTRETIAVEANTVQSVSDPNPGSEFRTQIRHESGSSTESFNQRTVTSMTPLIDADVGNKS